VNIDIRGYHGTIENLDELLNEIKGFPCTVQLIDARAVAGSGHALHGTLHALRAFERNQNISGDPGIEICLRIAGTRQISRALELLGVREGEMGICAILVDCGADVQEFLDSRFQRDDTVLEPDEDYLRNLYELGDEVETIGVENALMERTTMLQVL
jgi:KEOPS complex subunit Cgi121